MIPKYEEDFYAWTMAEADLLRKGQFSALDVQHLIEELESMGASEKREFISRLAQLLMHLLKWNFQPALRSKSWQITLREQRRAVSRLIKENPSFKSKITDCVIDAYEDAIDMAMKETGLDEKAFPEKCPYTFEQLTDNEFYPE
jgi:hypothetical protein